MTVPAAVPPEPPEPSEHHAPPAAAPSATPIGDGRTFPLVPGGGYHPGAVDWWVRAAVDHMEDLSARVEAAEARSRRLGPMPRSEALDRALRTVLEEAGRAADSILAEARERAVSLVDVAQRQADEVTTRAEVDAATLLERRRVEVEASLHRLTEERDRLQREVDLLRMADRVAYDAARGALEHLRASLAVVEGRPRPARTVLDLTDGARPPEVLPAGRQPTAPTDGPR